MTRTTTRRTSLLAAAALLLVSAGSRCRPGRSDLASRGGRCPTLPSRARLGAKVALDPFGNATAVWSPSAAGSDLVRAAHRPAGGTWGAPSILSGPGFAPAPDVVVDPSDTRPRSGGPTRLPPFGVEARPGRRAAPGGRGRALADGERPISPASTGRGRRGNRHRGSGWSSAPSPSSGQHLGPGLADRREGSVRHRFSSRPAGRGRPGNGALRGRLETFDGTYSVIKATRRPAGGGSRRPSGVGGRRERHLPQVTIDGRGTRRRWLVVRQVLRSVTSALWSSAPGSARASCPAIATSGDAAPRSPSSAPGETGRLASWPAARRSSGPRRDRPVAPGRLQCPRPSPPSGSCCPSAGAAPDGTASVPRPGPGQRPPAPGGPPPAGGGWSAPVDVAAEPAASTYPARRSPSTATGTSSSIWRVAGPTTVAGCRRSTSRGRRLGIGRARPRARRASRWPTPRRRPTRGRRWRRTRGPSATAARRPGRPSSHTYAEPGSYTVTLTVTDAVGNATTRTATTTVAAPRRRPRSAIHASSSRQTKIATDEKTKLKVKLNTAATLKLVFKSKHKHVIKGKKKYLKVVLKKKLPAGLSKITIKGKVKGKMLTPDTYVLTGTAKNTTGKSTRRRSS